MCALSPPVAANEVPLTIPAWSDAKKTTSGATSSGSTHGTPRGLLFQQFGGGVLILRRITARCASRLLDGLRVAILVPGQGGVDQAGDDGVHRDVVRPEFECRRFHQPDDSPLGC